MEFRVTDLPVIQPMFDSGGCKFRLNCVWGRECGDVREMLETLENVPDYAST